MKHYHYTLDQLLNNQPGTPCDKDCLLPQHSFNPSRGRSRGAGDNNDAALLVIGVLILIGLCILTT
jgi:hypothetical protein